MLPEIGHFALILALCLSVCQIIAGSAGVVCKNQTLMSMTRSCSYGQFYFVAVSFIILMLSFGLNDFSLGYVAANSNTQLPLIYRLCAVWGAHEGSMLLWVFVLSIWTAGVSYFSHRLPLDIIARVLVVLALVAMGFYLFILFTSNPFLRLLTLVPVNGRDLNPLLQDPGLVSHPPMLYMGYVGMSVPFAFAIAALWAGRFDANWARWSRPWTTLAWCFLTLGIVLGSWWAYRELGWGGFWFWDPVENASFLPWLVATALIHSLMVTEKRNHFKSWTVLLAICAFSLSLIGTFLVRSGVLISVHAFAIDPRRGEFILRYLFLTIGISLLLYAWRGRKVVSKNNFSIFSRESFILANNMLFFVAMLTILLGTLYPLIVDVLGWGKISVGAPYFNAVFIPIFIPLVLLMGLGPSFYWQYRNPKALIRPMIIIFIVAITLALLIPLIFWHQDYQVVLGLFLAFWLLLTTLYYRYQQGFTIKYPRQWGVIFAHIGLSITIVGVVLASSYSDQRDLRLQMGEKAKLGPYVFQLLSVSKAQGPNYTAARANVVIRKQGQQIALLHPEYRLYSVVAQAMSKTSIDIGWRRDLYVALGEPYTDGSWSMRIYYKPFVRWIWFGGLLMVFGGLLTVFFRNRNVQNKEKLA